MIARWVLMAATLAAPSAHAEPAPSVRGQFEAAWQRAECNQPIDMALNNARYHVLGGTLSPLDGIGPQDLTIDALVSRAHDPAVKEVILALNATVDGQTTAHYITDLLHDANVTVTRLAHGVPVGGELDYLDEGTLSAAIKQRTAF